MAGHFAAWVADNQTMLFVGVAAVAAAALLTCPDCCSCLVGVAAVVGMNWLCLTSLPESRRCYLQACHFVTAQIEKPLLAAPENQHDGNDKNVTVLQCSMLRMP